MNQEQFTDYLFKGHGRAYLYLQQHPTTEFHDTLLHACLYNPCYDPKYEGSRAEYLQRLIDVSPDASSYTQQILDALANPAVGMDVDQLFDFVLIWDQRGHISARQVLYERCAEFASMGDTWGAWHLIKLDGMDGFLFMVQRLGEAVNFESDLWDYSYVLRSLEDQMEPDQLHDALAHARATQPVVDRYLTAVEQKRAKRKQVADQGQVQGQLPFADLSKVIRKPPRWVGFVSLKNWGRDASTEELEQAARTLLTVSDTKRLRAYLTIFGDRPFPLDVHSLFPLARHQDELVSLHTLQILKSFHHPDVRALAFELLGDDRTNDNALTLLTHNYLPGDEEFMATLLARTRDYNGIHGLGLAINEVFEQNPTPRAADLMLTLYERSPCSSCRLNSIRRLIEWDALPSWIAAEARYDANEGIRDAVANNES